MVARGSTGQQETSEKLLPKDDIFAVVFVPKGSRRRLGEGQHPGTSAAQSSGDQVAER